MTFRESLRFSYAGISSDYFGIYNVTLNQGLYNEPFIAERNIKETTIRYNQKPYFQGVELQPLSFPITFAFAEPFNKQKLREMARWLSSDYYQPLIFSNDPERVFLCIVTGTSEINHTGNNEGYITVNFRCDSPWTYSIEYISDTYDYSYNPTNASHIFLNKGDFPLYPKIWITKIGSGDISIKNITNDNLELKFTNLINNETVFIDCENEIIISDLPDIYRYDNFNGNYLSMLPVSFNSNGFNTISITGSCKLKFKYRFKFIS